MAARSSREEKLDLAELVGLKAACGLQPRAEAQKLQWRHRFEDVGCATMTFRIVRTASGVLRRCGSSPVAAARAIEFVQHSLNQSS